MATITKTPSGTWKAIIRKTGWPTTIKTFRTKRDAQDWARGVEDEMVRGVHIRRSVAEKLLFTDALDRYAREITVTKKESTQLREVRRFQVLRNTFGSYSLAAINSEMIARFRDERLAQGLAANSVRLELALIGHLYTVAIKEWGTGLTHNPVALITKPSPGKSRDRRLSIEEEIALFAEIKRYSNPMLNWVVQIALETGMRHSEIVGLEYYQVDVERRIVRLTDTKNNDSRTVPLTMKATQIFKSAMTNPVLKTRESMLIFAGEAGKDGKCRPYLFNKAWRSIILKLGLDGLHFHDLRHEAVSRLVESGLSDQEVASISGHKSMQMLRRYTHLRAEDLVVKLDGIEKAKKEI